MRVGMALLAVGLLGLQFAARAQADVFIDGFEASALDPFWKTYAVSGSITFPSSAVVHSGKQSVQLNSYQGGGQKGMQFTHTFDTPVYGSFSIWVYDTGANVSSSNWISFFASPKVATPNGWGAMLYATDYDQGTPSTGSTYGVSRPVEGALITNVDRTQAWHQFQIDALRDGASMSIDGNVVWSGAAIDPISTVNFAMYSPDWRPGWTTYFDDFNASFTPVPEPGAMVLVWAGLLLIKRKRLAQSN